MLVDVHVHLHPCFEPGEALDAADRNFARAAARLELPDPSTVLMLARPDDRNAFEGLLDGRPGGGPERGRSVSGGWHLSSRSEPTCLVAERDGRRLYLVAGRQLVTPEGLEVLALGTLDPVPPHSSLEATVEAVSTLGALPVLPWGVGKWTGARGRRVRDFLAEGGSERVVLADNGGRLARWPTPELLRSRPGSLPPKAAGSDPFPFPGEEARIASYGTCLATPLDPERPTTSVLEALADPGIDRSTFGSLQSLPRFLASQLRMQLRKLDGPLPARCGNDA